MGVASLPWLGKGFTLGVEGDADGSVLQAHRSQSKLHQSG